MKNNVWNTNLNLLKFSLFSFWDPDNWNSNREIVQKCVACSFSMEDCQGKSLGGIFVQGKVALDFMKYLNCGSDKMSTIYPPHPTLSPPPHTPPTHPPNLKYNQKIPSFQANVASSSKMLIHLMPVPVDLRDTGSIRWWSTVRRNQNRTFRLCQSSSSSSGSNNSSSWNPGSHLSPGQRPGPAPSCQPSRRRWRSRWRSAEPPNIAEPLGVLMLTVDFPSLQLVPPIRTYQSQQVEVTEHHCLLIFK